MSARAVAATVILSGLVALAACGKKGDPERPEGATYPQRYPAPETVIPDSQASAEEEEDVRRTRTIGNDRIDIFPDKEGDFRSLEEMDDKE